MKTDAEYTLELRFHPGETCFPVDPETNVSGFAFLSEPNRIVYHGRLYQLRTFTFYFPKRIATGCFCGTSSTYKHDFQRISILYDIFDRPHYVYFYAHSRYQGVWCKWKDCEKTDDGVLVVYIAKHSHALYPAPYRYLRRWGFANDVCSRRGKTMRPNFIRTRCIYYANGMQMTSTTIYPPPPHFSITRWERFFLGFYKDNLHKKEYITANRDSLISNSSRLNSGDSSYSF